jgi:hypothetical protein
MEDLESEMPCAHLTRQVAKMPADKFYNEFNLSSTAFFAVLLQGDEGNLSSSSNGSMAKNDEFSRHQQK